MNEKTKKPVGNMSEGELRAELKANRDSLRNLHAEVTSMKQQMSRQRYHSATAMAPPGMDTIVQGWANIFGEKISEDLSSYMTGRGQAAPGPMQHLHRAYGMRFADDVGRFALPGTDPALGGDFLRIFRQTGYGRGASPDMVGQSLQAYNQQFGALRSMIGPTADMIRNLYAVIAQTRGPKDAAAFISALDNNLRGLGYGFRDSITQIQHMNRLGPKYGMTLSEVQSANDKLTQSYVGSNEMMAGELDQMLKYHRVTGRTVSSLAGVSGQFKGFKQAATHAQTMMHMTGRGLPIDQMLGAAPGQLLNILQERMAPITAQGPSAMYGRAGQFRLEMLGDILGTSDKREVMRQLFPDEISIRQHDIESDPIMGRFRDSLRVSSERSAATWLQGFANELAMVDPVLAAKGEFSARSILGPIAAGITPEMWADIETISERAARGMSTLNTKMTQDSKLYAGIQLLLNVARVGDSRARAIIEAAAAGAIITAGGPRRADRELLPAVTETMNVVRSIVTDPQTVAGIAKLKTLGAANLGTGPGAPSQEQVATQIAGYAKDIYESTLGQALSEVIIKVIIDGHELKTYLSKAIKGGAK